LPHVAAGRNRRAGYPFYFNEIGLWATENKVRVHDIHATIRHCCGLSDEKLTYLHNGRDERPTVNGGKVIKAVLA